MKRLVLISLLFLTTHVFSQDVVTKIIQLQYIAAPQAIKLMQPLLQEGDNVSGTGQTLIAKVSPETLTQIRTLLRQVDVPPVTFNVSIYQGNAQWLSKQNDNSVSYSTSTRSQKLQSQSVQVMNGNSALVSMDQEVPIVTSIGAGYFSGITYQQHPIKNGLLVHPVLHGSQVELGVRRLREQMNPAGGQQFDNQKIDTTVMVPLNKWVSLGSPEGAEPTNNNATYYTSGNTFDQQSTLYIKVTIVGRDSDGDGNGNAVDSTDGSQGW